jgi:hypothetical protein
LAKERLLREPQQRAALRYAAREAARPNAATLIAERIINLTRFTPYALLVTIVDYPSLSTHSRRRAS